MAFVVDGGALIAGGSFDEADGKPARSIARWNGLRWSAMGSGLDDTVQALALHDGAIVAGGEFEEAGGNDSDYWARWSCPGSPVVDVDGDGEARPLTDGLLALRWLSDFTGDALINGAVDPSCTRCTAAAVDTYLGSIESLLDIDDDGEALPLTDGILNLRWLFGFRGAVLTTGATSQTCLRCLDHEIESYLDGLD